MNANGASIEDGWGRVFPWELLPLQGHFRQPILQPDEALKQEDRCPKSDQSRQEYEQPDALSFEYFVGKNWAQPGGRNPFRRTLHDTCPTCLPRRRREAHSDGVMSDGGHSNGVVLDRKLALLTLCSLPNPPNAKARRRRDPRQ
jgi:hypothetical protein